MCVRTSEGVTHVSPPTQPVNPGPEGTTGHPGRRREEERGVHEDEGFLTVVGQQSVHEGVRPETDTPVRRRPDDAFGETVGGGGPGEQGLRGPGHTDTSPVSPAGRPLRDGCQGPDLEAPELRPAPDRVTGVSGRG